MAVTHTLLPGAPPCLQPREAALITTWGRAAEMGFLDTAVYVCLSVFGGLQGPRSDASPPSWSPRPAMLSLLEPCFI